MIIVAILQNQWFKDPDRARKSYERIGTTPEMRARLNAQFLFYKSLTGRRLKAAFGRRCDEIIWEEASKHIGGKSSASAPHDPEHLTAVFEHFKPDVVLAFGQIAMRGVSNTFTGQIIKAPHPAARNAEVPRKLADAAAMLENLIGPDL